MIKLSNYFKFNYELVFFRFFSVKKNSHNIAYSSLLKYCFEFFHTLQLKTSLYLIRIVCSKATQFNCELEEK